MGQERQAEQPVLEGLRQQRGQRVDRPQDAEQPEGHHGGDDLVGGQRRDHQADRHQGRAQQHEADIAAVERT